MHGPIVISMSDQSFFFSEDVRSLSLPGTYHEKISNLGTALRKFTRLKHLDLSRNAIDSLEVCTSSLYYVLQLIIHVDLIV